MHNAPNVRVAGGKEGLINLTETKLRNLEQKLKMLLTQFCRVGHGSMHREEEKEGAEHRQTGENEQTKTKERNET